MVKRICDFCGKELMYPSYKITSKVNVFRGKQRYELCEECMNEIYRQSRERRNNG